MILALSDIFPNAALTVIQSVAAALPFEDGARTAGRLARQVKQNHQAADSSDRAALLEKVAAALLAHPVFVSAARPKAMVRLMVSRYGVGDRYGRHVDDALMNGGRTDLSFTLFLSDPAAYEGGALVIEDGLESRKIKLTAGQLILYPSTTLHHVEPVTSGERLAVVGWVQSHVRDASRREILFDLDRAFALAEAENASQELLLNLSKARSNLIRMWAD